MRTLEEMENTAQRHLDGMTVNRDVMARDVLAMVRAIRSAQKRESVSRSGGFTGAFTDIFSGMFGKK